MEPITTTIGAVKTGIELLKSLRGMAREFKSAGFNEKLMELYGVMMELQGKLSELQIDNETLRDETRGLREKISLKQSLRFDSATGDYWLDGEHGTAGPFCSRCFDVDGRAVRMHPGHSGAFCPECMLQRNIHKKQ